ncbi:hypothetical protein [Rhizobium straminoryzae]|uniref:Uncharacterized protein n=1 Tax=Rhizobium straminoryzae TaxID=1387186 RepID=A0A549TFQ2_9HYPH|nr:hypothetical protein [Rhizobium straminoryzae]TRL41336.1 hypothetical protein FNA46_05215 [Rhizobium straminoryzae]
MKRVTTQRNHACFLFMTLHIAVFSACWLCFGAFGPEALLTLFLLIAWSRPGLRKLFEFHDDPSIRVRATAA